MSLSVSDSGKLAFDNATGKLLWLQSKLVYVNVVPLIPPTPPTLIPIMAGMCKLLVPGVYLAYFDINMGPPQTSKALFFTSFYKYDDPKIQFAITGDIYHAWAETMPANTPNEILASPPWKNDTAHFALTKKKTVICNDLTTQYDATITYGSFVFFGHCHPIPQRAV